MEKRLWWIKITDHFFTSDNIDFLMSQKNGSEYVVIYQLLCLKTVNTNGVLARQLGDILVEFNEEKIQRDLKYFDIDTIRVALDLYKRMGLIYYNDDGIMTISHFENIVGSESSSAKRVREYRDKKALQCNKNVTQCNAIDIDIEKEKEKDKDINNKGKSESIREKICTLYDNLFKKQMTPIEAEIIEKWEQENVPYKIIEAEMTNSAKLGKTSLIYTDSVIIKKRVAEEQNPIYSKTDDILEGLKEKWKKQKKY